MQEALRGSPEDGARRKNSATGLALVLCVAAALALRTWNTWPDVLVDFGREAYAPWRLTAGDTLHRDLAWFNGPLSAYWNSALMALCGTSLRTLFLGNLCLLLLCLLLAHRLMERIAGPLAATCAGLFFVCVSAFNQYGGIGNYNFVAPYSHELTHGMLLALAGLAVLEGATASNRSKRLFACGLLLGLCYLTKTEVFLAAAVALGVRVALLLRADTRAGLGSARLGACAFGGGLLLPLLGAWGLLCTQLGAGSAGRALIEPWIQVLSGTAADSVFYKRMMGRDELLPNVLSLLGWSAFWLGLLALPVVAARFLPAEKGRSKGLAALLAGATCAGLLAFMSEQNWLECARPLPLACLLIAVHAAGCIRSEKDPERAAARIALALFALILTLKILLRTTLVAYGFALALPAAWLVIAVGVAWIPTHLEERGRPATAPRAVALAMLLALILAHLNIANRWRGYRIHPVGFGADIFRADGRGDEVQALLAALQTRVAALDHEHPTLLALPEGVMINYLARIPAPTRHTSFMPPELAMFDEESMLAELRAAPPDWIAIVHKDTSEYGAPFFGSHYGMHIARWVAENYKGVELFGDQPLVDRRFGIILMERR